ncbi:DUF4897 domain-containing protein [Salinilacihabitans rarus]|uniref:DUF4897 domain-containing protein n=1 Tax=Salinilacihabitans rarus TaxID=2961596 RepID=UPI0020C851EE|nr:DUF4897 domain-containing protein [Salinilacihabitans rarus]
MNRRTDRARRTDSPSLVPRTLTAALVAVVLLGSVIGGVGARAATTDDASQPTDSAFVVDLEADGDATTSVTVGFDLESETDRDAFESLRENETKRERLENRTERRLRAVAAEATEETDREMTLEDADVSFEVDEANERGIVTVSATWRSLAAVEGDRLTLGEPFATGFAPDRTVVVHLPEGYALESATPAPTDRDDRRLVWNSSTSLEGYEAVVTPAETSGVEPQPGFGIATAIAAIAIVGTALGRRRH